MKKKTDSEFEKLVKKVDNMHGSIELLFCYKDKFHERIEKLEKTLASVCEVLNLRQVVGVGQDTHNSPYSKELDYLTESIISIKSKLE